MYYFIIKMWTLFVIFFDQISLKDINSYRILNHNFSLVLTFNHLSHSTLHCL